MSKLAKYVKTLINYAMLFWIFISTWNDTPRESFAKRFIFIFQNYLKKEELTVRDLLDHCCDRLNSGRMNTLGKYWNISKYFVFTNLFAWSVTSGIWRKVSPVPYFLEYEIWAKKYFSFSLVNFYLNGSSSVKKNIHPIYRITVKFSRKTTT